MKKFWLGFWIGLSGVILGLAGLLDCKSKEQKGKFLSGWCLGTLALVIMILFIVMIILGGK